MLLLYVIQKFISECENTSNRQGGMCYCVIMAKKSSKLHQDVKYCSFRVVLVISMELLIKGKGKDTKAVTHFASLSLC